MKKLALGCALVCALLGDGRFQPAAPQPKPEGEMRWALYVTLSPVWFDPGEVVGVITPFWVLYAMHDALVKPMPGNLMTPSLAESWTVSADQRVYEFKLREGVKFHNGDAFTAEDVKFSFQRTKGTKILKEKVREITVVDPVRVRFQLHEPFPDFMTFYGTLTTGAGWIVPKKYIEKVGDEGFRKHPIGLGPYKFVSYTPGIELIVEAYEGYWRKMPHVKRIVFRTVPDPATRLAMLKKGEVDVAYDLEGDLGEELKRDPKLRVAFSGGIGVDALNFLEGQWDPKSPWHDQRVRLAASYAIDRQAISDAETLGASIPTGSLSPREFEFALPIEPHPYDPVKAKQLLAEAGYPNGFDGGDFFPAPPFFARGEMVVNYLTAVGIKVRLRTMERAAQQAAYTAKQLRGLCLCGTARYGNAATRLEELAVSTGVFAYGGYPDIDELFKQQEVETDRSKREALVHKMQQLVHQRRMFVPIFLFVWPSGIGPRVEESGLWLIKPYPWA